MLLGCLPLVIGWSIIATSYVFTKDPDVQKFYSMLMVGRGLSGFGIGCLSLVVPVSSTACGKKVVMHMGFRFVCLCTPLNPCRLGQALPRLS